jgi:hypothetical protein
LPGYVLVEAPAMYGKSALFANLVSRAEQGSWGNGPTPDLVFFFVREGGGRNTASAFLTAVNSQLLAVIGSMGALAGEQEAQRSQFSQLWSVASKAANSFRPLLLVDGLDESASDGLSILPFLPSNLEPYVHVFTSVRRDVPLPSLGVEHPLSRAVQLSLDALELTGVEQMLGARAVDLAPRVLAITGGEPLFTVLVGADVAAGGRSDLGSWKARSLLRSLQSVTRSFASISPCRPQTRICCTAIDRCGRCSARFYVTPTRPGSVK